MFVSSIIFYLLHLFVCSIARLIYCICLFQAFAISEINCFSRDNDDSLIFLEPVQRENDPEASANKDRLAGKVFVLFPFILVVIRFRLCSSNWLKSEVSILRSMVAMLRSRQAP